jgi:L-aspartate oxidase
MRADLTYGVPVDAEPSRWALPGVADALEFEADAGPRLQAAMWRDVGLFRNRISLETVVDEFEPMWRSLAAWTAHDRPLDAEGWRVVSLLTVGRLIARAALRREESRGGHYRDDFPARDDIHWKRRVADRL